MEVEQVTELENSIKTLTEHTQHYVPTEDLEHLYAVIEAAEKVSKYETAEEEGRLKMFPCKIGDTVYVIEKRYYNYLWHTGVQEGRVRGFEYDKEWVIWVSLNDDNPSSRNAYKFENFGKTVFLIREEAEKALKKLNEK